MAPWSWNPGWGKWIRIMEVKKQRRKGNVTTSRSIEETGWNGISFRWASRRQKLLTSKARRCWFGEMSCFALSDSPLPTGPSHLGPGIIHDVTTSRVQSILFPKSSATPQNSSCAPKPVFLSFLVRISLSLLLPHSSLLVKKMLPVGWPPSLGWELPEGTTVSQLCISRATYLS